MTDNIPKICAAFEMWQDNDCIQAGTTLELIMRYLADDPEIDYQVADVDRDGVVQDYIGRQNENLNAKTLIIRELNKDRVKDKATIDEFTDRVAMIAENTDHLNEVIHLYFCETQNLESELKTAKSDYEVMRTNHRNMVAKPTDDIEDLNTQLTDERAIVDKNTLLRVNEVETRQGLEAELSARKEDSAVLMKVVDAIRYWESSSPHSSATVTEIKDIIDDYIDAPEGPPETPIDDLYRVSVFLEMP